MSRHVTRMFYAVAAGFALIASGLVTGSPPSGTPGRLAEASGP